MNAAANFGIIRIDPEVAAFLFQQFLDIGTNTHNLAITDIHVNVTEETDIATMTNPGKLVERGAKLFDAIAWCLLEEDERPAIVIVTGYLQENARTLVEVARLFFVAFFFLVAQARYPNVGTGAQLTNMPQFVTQTMGIRENQAEVAAALASFDLVLFNPAWIKHINFGQIGQEVKSRFGLGMAGMRLFAVFLNNPTTRVLGAEELAACEFCRAVAGMPADWSFHPVTRDPNLLTRFGSFNKNIANLLLACYTPVEIVAIVKSRQLYTHPTPEAGVNKWRTWSVADLPAFNDPILPPT